MRSFSALPAALLVLLLASPARSQENPFADGPDNPFAAEPAVDANESAFADAQAADPLVRQLLDRVGRSPVDRAKVIAALARIGRWTELDGVLTRTDLGNIDGPTKSAMSAEIGPDLFIRIQQNEQVSDAAKAVLQEIGRAAIAEIESAELIRAAIDQLNSHSVDDRLAANRRLLSGGNTAIAELVSTAVTTDDSNERDAALRVLLRFGDEGIKALRQLQLYGDPAVRLRALEALARVNRKVHQPQLLSALYSRDSTDEEVAAARRILSYDHDSIPTAAEALATLEADFRSKRDEADRIDNDDQRAQIWLVENGDSVKSQLTFQLLAHYRDVTDAAARLRRLGNLPAGLRQDVLAADLAYRLLVDPDWGDPPQIALMQSTYPDVTSLAELSSTLDRALEQQDLVAAVGLLRMIRSIESGPAERSIFLSGSAGSPSPLVDAANHPEPQVRYEAALAAAKLGGLSPYAGSSNVLRTLSEMNALDPRPTVLLLETRPTVILRLEQILSKLGFKPRVVSTVAGLQRAIASGGDMRMVLSKTDLPDRMAVEMIDLVRRMPRGEKLPIVFYGDDEVPLSWKRWSAPTIQIGLPSSTAALDGIIDEINRRGRLTALSTIDRQRYQQEAAEQLQQILGES